MFSSVVFIISLILRANSKYNNWRHNISDEDKLPMATHSSIVQFDPAKEEWTYYIERLD